MIIDRLITLSHVFSGAYFTGLSDELKKEKAGLLTKWLSNELDDELLHIYYKTSVINCQPFQSLLELSLNIGELVQYNIILEEKHNFLKSKRCRYISSNNIFVFEK